MLGWEDEGVGRGERGEGWEYGVVGGRRLGVRSREKHTEVRGGGGANKKSWFTDTRRQSCLVMGT